MVPSMTCLSFFFFNDTATTEIYTLSLHDALPILFGNVEGEVRLLGVVPAADRRPTIEVWLVRRLRRTSHTSIVGRDRKSTRLNSSHGYISYAVFCLKKKKSMTIFTQFT